MAGWGGMASWGGAPAGGMAAAVSWVGETRGLGGSDFIRAPQLPQNCASSASLLPQSSQNMVNSPGRDTVRRYGRALPTSFLGIHLYTYSAPTFMLSWNMPTMMVWVSEPSIVWPHPTSPLSPGTISPFLSL